MSDVVLRRSRGEKSRDQFRGERGMKFLCGRGEHYWGGNGSDWLWGSGVGSWSYVALTGHSGGAGRCDRESERESKDQAFEVAGGAVPSRR